MAVTLHLATINEILSSSIERINTHGKAKAIQMINNDEIYMFKQESVAYKKDIFFLGRFSYILIL